MHQPICACRDAASRAELEDLKSENCVHLCGSADYPCDCGNVVDTRRQIHLPCLIALSASESQGLARQTQAQV